MVSMEGQHFIRVAIKRPRFNGRGAVALVHIWGTSRVLRHHHNPHQILRTDASGLGRLTLSDAYRLQANQHSPIMRGVVRHDRFNVDARVERIRPTLVTSITVSAPERAGLLDFI